MWQAETQFLTALSQPHHQKVVMKLPKADYMEVAHGHPAITTMLVTTYKLTCFMSLLSVLLLLKETQMLITGQQSTSYSCRIVVQIGSSIEKAM